MKKLLALFIAILFVFTLTACGISVTPAGQTEKSENNSSVESADAEAAEDSGADAEAVDDDKLNPADITDWKEYVKEYEARVDEFIEIYKKYKEKPLDTALMSKYLASAEKVTKWAEQAQELVKKLTTEDLTQFAEELDRIAKKTEENVDE